ncbi:MAG: hydroxyacid dehydrogenase [Proteobacteria bacterium]|nr:hydroxyacid dehydrogenase [Pseudomonadota bacterium]
MRIALAVRGFSHVRRILAAAFGDEAIVECDASDIVDVAREVDVIVPIMTRLPQAALTGGRLKLVQQYGVGLDIVDIDAASRAGVLVANVPSVGSGNAESVAELAVLLMLMLGRQVPLAQQRFRERRFSGPMGRALWGSTVVILGHGGIGEEIARRLGGFGARLVAVSRHGPRGERARDPAVNLERHVAATELMEVLGEADYLVVAAPATPDNIGLVDARVLGALKPGAFLVNIARGQVIEYQALLEALRSGHLAGAGLDVFWTEPFDPDDALLQYNVIATPHVGGVTEESLRGIGAAVVRNIEKLERGELPEHCVNADVWPKLRAALAGAP